MPAVYGAPLLGSDQPSGEGVKPESDQHSSEGIKTDTIQTSDEVVASKPANQETGPPPVFPVIVFSHGLGGMRTNYCGIFCDLASNGYVVAAVEHRYSQGHVSIHCLLW